MKAITLTDGFQGFELTFGEALGTFRYSVKKLFILHYDESLTEVKTENQLMEANQKNWRFFIKN